MEKLRFEDLNLSKEMQKAVAGLDFEEATPIQYQSIPYILKGKDIIGQAQTGTGEDSSFWDSNVRDGRSGKQESTSSDFVSHKRIGHPGGRRAEKTLKI